MKINRNWKEIAEIMGYERERDMFKDFIQQGWAQRKMSWKISRAIYKKTGVIDEIPQPTIYLRLNRLRKLGRLDAQTYIKYQRNYPVISGHR